MKKFRLIRHHGDTADPESTGPFDWQSIMLYESFVLGRDPTKPKILKILPPTDAGSRVLQLDTKISAGDGEWRKMSLWYSVNS